MVPRGGLETGDRRAEPAGGETTTGEKTALGGRWRGGGIHGSNRALSTMRATPDPAVRTDGSEGKGNPTGSCHPRPPLRSATGACGDTAWTRLLVLVSGEATLARIVLPVRAPGAQAPQKRNRMSVNSIPRTAIVGTGTFEREGTTAFAETRLAVFRGE